MTVDSVPSVRGRVSFRDIVRMTAEGTGVLEFDEVVEMAAKGMWIRGGKVVSLKRGLWGYLGEPCLLEKAGESVEFRTDRGMVTKGVEGSWWTEAGGFEEAVKMVVGRLVSAGRMRGSARALGVSEFEMGKRYFSANRESLIAEHEGEYIAIWQNRVVASDKSFSKVAERVYGELGYVDIYIPFVSSKARVLRFESPRYERRRTSGG